MFPILLTLFIAVPIIEISLFITVGGWLGAIPTIGLVIFTAFAGAALVRNQGLQTLQQVQLQLHQGELPAQAMVEGLLLAICGVLLLTPGFMTDALGLTVLLPQPRALLAQYLIEKFKMRMVSGQQSQSFHFQQHFEDRSSNGTTIDGEFERKDKDDDSPRLR